MNTKRQMSDTFLIGAILAIVGGFLDSYTFICKGGVFANAQTGNIVLLGIDFAGGKFQNALHYLAPVFAFIFGIFISELIKYYYKNSENMHWRQIIILFEVVILICVAFISGEKFNTISNILVSFVCALQVQSFRKINGKSYVSTMCTGNLRSATEKFVLYRQTKNKKDLTDSLQYYGIIGFFIVGATIGAFLANKLGSLSMLFVCGGLVFVFIIMFYKKAEERNFI